MSFVLLAFLLFATAPVLARDDGFVPDPEPPTPRSLRDAPGWSEEDSPLPPWPAESDLIRFAVDGPDQGFRYAIDGRTLSIGSDDVVRYTLVADSASGARNVSAEGIRCTPSGHYRVYAHGVTGQFTPVHDGGWRPIAKDETDRYRYDLWRSYLCVHLKFTPRPRRDMLRALRRGRTSRLENAGFMAD